MTAHSKVIVAFQKLLERKNNDREQPTHNEHAIDEKIHNITDKLETMERTIKEL
jgi:hypothetical protein